MKRSTLYLLALVLVSFMLATLLPGSSGLVQARQPHQGTEDGILYLPVASNPLPPIIPDTTVLLTGATIQHLTSASDDLSTLTFAGMTPELAAVDGGDVIVSGPTGDFPFGFLRAVTAVSSTAGNVTLHTEPAALNQAITQGELDWQRTFTAADVIAVSAHQGVTVQPAAAANDEFYVSIPALDDSCLSVTGSITIPRFRVDYDASIESWQLQEMRFIVSQQVIDDFGLDVVCQGSRDREWTLAQFYLTPIVVPVGFVPVVFVPKLDVVLGVEGTIEAGLSFAVTLDVTTTAGVIYEDGNFQTVGDFTADVDGSVTPVVGAGVKAYAGPELSLLLYGVVGPYLQNVIYGEWQANVEADPWWTLYWGLEAPVGAEMEIFGHDIADWEAVAIGYRDIITYEGAGEETTSTFDGTSTDGWTLYLGTLENPGSGGSGGGDDNGYLYTAPPGDSRTSYFIAPAGYHGDWRRYAELRFDLWSSGGSYYTSGYQSYGDVYLANGDMTAQLLLPRRPAADWDSFTVQLDDGQNWTLGGGAQTLDDVLQNVTDLQIRAEYGVGGDETGLDNVQLLSETQQ